MPYTQAEMERDLRSLGIHRGDTVLMHSSYKSLGGVEGGVDAVFGALLSCLGDTGTLVLPTLSYESVTPEHPYFDLRTTPSCIGFLPEYFRTRIPGVKRSLHATHSCAALGPRAAYLISNHEKDDTPVGVHSPFHKLPEIGGKILILGCDPEHNTSLHGVEETCEPPYLFGTEPRVLYHLTDGEGQTRTVLSRRHWFGGEHVYAQRYERILDLLNPDKGEKQEGYVLEAHCYLMEATAVWEKGHEALLKNRFHFVDKPVTEA